MHLDYNHAKKYVNHWGSNLNSDAQKQLKIFTDLSKNTQRILSAAREQERSVLIPSLAFFANYQGERTLEGRNASTIHDFLWYTVVNMHHPENGTAMQIVLEVKLVAMSIKLFIVCVLLVGASQISQDGKATAY